MKSYCCHLVTFSVKRFTHAYDKGVRPRKWSHGVVFGNIW